MDPDDTTFAPCDYPYICTNAVRLMIRDQARALAWRHVLRLPEWIFGDGALPDLEAEFERRAAAVGRAGAFRAEHVRAAAASEWYDAVEEARREWARREAARYRAIWELGLARHVWGRS